MFFPTPTFQNQSTSQNTSNCKSIAKRRETHNNQIRRNDNSKRFDQKREVNMINNDYHWADSKINSLYYDSEKEYNS